MLQALQALARHSIIHRDIKPANILLSKTGAKLADFGFARTVARPVSETYNIGTPMYMPPEALQHNLYTPKHDVWSFGVLAFELLTGRTPFKAHSLQHLALQLARPVVISSMIHEPFAELIRECLKPQEDRASVATLLALPLEGPDDRFERTLPKSQWAPRDTMPLMSKTAEHFSLKGKSPSKEEFWEASKVIVSRINYCRYIYKVIRMLEDMGLEMPSQLPLLLKAKIERLAADMQAQGHQGREFDKLRSIVREYKQRYERVATEGVFDQELISLQCELLISRAFRQLTSAGAPDEYLPEHESRIATLLDYTISLTQILRVEAVEGEEEACRKVDIGKMVEGKPARVQYFHREHMRKKLLHLKLL